VNRFNNKRTDENGTNLDYISPCSRLKSIEKLYKAGNVEISISEENHFQPRIFHGILGIGT